MKKFSKKIIIIYPVFIFLLALFYLFIINLSYNNSLSGSKIDNIYFKDVEYTINDGEILKSVGDKAILSPTSQNAIYRLGYYKLLTSEQPILATNLTDDDEQIDALDRMDSLQKEIQQRQGLSDDIVQTDLVKLSVLLSQDLEKLQKRTSFETVSQYKEQQNKLLNGYDDSLVKLTQMLETNKADLRGVMGISTVTDGTLLADSLSTLKQNIGILRKEIENRNRRLVSPFFPVFTVRSNDKIKDIKRDKYQIISLPDDYLFIPEEYKSAKSAPFSVETACFDGENRTKYFYTYFKKTNSGKLEFVPKLMDTNYYSSVSDNDLMDKWYFDNGYKWRPITESNVYRCPDNSYQIKLLNLSLYLKKYDKPLVGEDIIKNFNNNSLSGEAKDVKAIASIEDDFYSGNIHSVEDLEIISDNYMYLYTLLRKSNLEANFKIDFRNQLLERRNFVKTKSDGLSYYYNGNFQLDAYDELSKADPKMSGHLLIYLYFIRGNYSIVYPNYSSLFGRGLNIKYFSKMQQAENSQYITFHKFISIYGEEYFREFNKIGSKTYLSEIKNTPLQY